VEKLRQRSRGGGGEGRVKGDKTEDKREDAGYSNRMLHTQDKQEDSAYVPGFMLSQVFVYVLICCRCVAMCLVLTYASALSQDGREGGRNRIFNGRQCCVH
jgi:hypothetical protein